jgi:F-type H+-transporting ATPase subunit epsilon
MADTLAVEVLTPEQNLLSGPAVAVVLRTPEGALTVLPGHAPTIGAVVAGEVRVEQEDSDVVRMAVHGGFVQVDTAPGAAGDLDPDASSPLAGLTTRVTVLAGVAELVDDIDVGRAEEALAEAQARLERLRASGGGRGAAEPEPATDLETADAEEAIKRAELRLELARPA